MATKKKNWIKAVTTKNPGAFSAKAKRAGMSTSAYAKKVTGPKSKASTKTKRQAVAAKNLAAARKKRSKY